MYKQHFLLTKITKTHFRCEIIIVTTGLFILGLLLFWQGLFVAEIRL